MKLLRGVLLIQVRISRFIEGFPDDEDMLYFDALMAKMRQLMSKSRER